MQGARVQSLVGELRSRMPWGTARKSINFFKVNINREQHRLALNPTGTLALQTPGALALLLAQAPVTWCVRAEEPDRSFLHCASALWWVTKRTKSPLPSALSPGSPTWVYLLQPSPRLRHGPDHFWAGEIPAGSQRTSQPFHVFLFPVTGYQKMWSNTVGSDTHTLYYSLSLSLILLQRPALRHLPPDGRVRGYRVNAYRVHGAVHLDTGGSHKLLPCHSPPLSLLPCRGASVPRQVESLPIHGQNWIETLSTESSIFSLRNTFEWLQKGNFYI